MNKATSEADQADTSVCGQAQLCIDPYQTVYNRHEDRILFKPINPSSLDLKLKALLPRLTNPSFMVMQRIVCSSPVFRISAARSQLIRYSTFKCQGNDQVFEIWAALQQDYITL